MRYLHPQIYCRDVYLSSIGILPRRMYYVITKAEFLSVSSLNVLLYPQIFSDLEDGLQSAVAEYNNTKDDGNQSVIKDAIDSIQSVS